MNVSSIRARLSVLTICLSLASLPAAAGDAAYPEALGFSQDGARFAFLEWGVQDGSGFAYANAYAIDLAQDVWLARPIRDVMEDETAEPRAVHRQTSAAADAALTEYKITTPARLIYARPPTGSNPAETSTPITWLSPIGDLETHEMTLAPFPLAAKSCTEQTFGLALSWGGKEIYRDRAISTSRGCPMSYTLERVFLPDHIIPSYAVALIGVWTFGFEGQDMRHIAIPIPLGAP